MDTYACAPPADATCITSLRCGYHDACSETPPTADQFWGRIDAATCWIVAERDGAVVGYASAWPFHARPASAHRRGIGAALLDELLDRLRGLGMANAMAGISLPNPASTRLFESRGFTRVAFWESGALGRDRVADISQNATPKSRSGNRARSGGGHIPERRTEVAFWESGTIGWRPYPKTLQ
ncbi:MAG: GNAT family N-acetyltransferase [Thermoleophilia bacterium]|nr:GNAT family N-acetyltransferase [Thermoleophilia bacterium]